MADRRGLDEDEVWSWPMVKLLTWLKHYAQQDSNAQNAMKGLLGV